MKQEKKQVLLMKTSFREGKTVVFKEYKGLTFRSSVKMTFDSMHLLNAARKPNDFYWVKCINF